MKPTHNVLGDFLRSRREQLEPERLGLPRLRRRTPGLRREEVAARAGIGVDWYVRLEQGRSSTPSRGTVEALARALQLNGPDRAHLRSLTRAERPAPFTPERAREPLTRVLATLRQPAYVTGRRWDVLAWNRAADRLLGFSRRPEQLRNILVFVLLEPEARRLFGAGWEGEARRIVAQFRAAFDLLGNAPEFVRLREQLAAAPEFERWWKAHDVGRAHSGIKVLHHPKLGTLQFEHTSYQVNDDPALRLVLLTPVAAPRARLKAAKR